MFKLPIGQALHPHRDCVGIDAADRVLGAGVQTKSALDSVTAEIVASQNTPMASLGA